jgi:hypothetical protein
VGFAAASVAPPKPDAPRSVAKVGRRRSQRERTATAILLSHRDAAKDLRNPPIHIESVGMSLGGIGAGVHLGDFTQLECGKAGEQLWSRTDLKPKDVDCAQIYDGFSIHVLMWLEGLGLAGRGEAAAFVEGGSRIGLDGELPLNTSGGQRGAPQRPRARAVAAPLSAPAVPARRRGAASRAIRSNSRVAATSGRSAPRSAVAEPRPNWLSAVLPRA